MIILKPLVLRQQMTKNLFATCISARSDLLIMPYLATKFEQLDKTRSYLPQRKCAINDTICIAIAKMIA